jgi:hypothetical protein
VTTRGRQAHLEGFDLHANVWMGAHDRAGVERLCRYILRPPFAQERLRLRSDGRVRPEPTASAPAAGPDGTGEKSPPRGWSWAALMHRAFAVDVLACPHCGGRLRLIATLHDPAVIRKILAHLGRAPSRPSPGPAPPGPGAAAP